MTLTVNLNKLIHRKASEYCTNLGAGNTTAGSFITASQYLMTPYNDNIYYVGGASVIWNYNADTDSWFQLPNSGIAGTFGAGACGEARSISCLGGSQTSTATAGTTTTITTNRTIVRNLAGVTLRVVAGTGIGYSGTIKSNTIGTNSVITLNTANGVAFDATTQFQVFAGSLWFFCPGAGAVGFRVYDKATAAWTAKSVTGLPTTFGTVGQLVSTPGYASSGYVNGTATAGTASTLTDSGKTWPTNGFTNYQVRIISGTGIGQIRTIASNTNTVLTTSAAWTVNPDATSVYRIESNDDFMYLLGNNAVTMYKYVISTDTWSTLSPGAARAGACAAGGTADFIDSVNDTTWSDGTYSAFATGMVRQNGRYIYSFRGGATNVLDVYDIAGNKWISGLSYQGQNETFTTGSNSIFENGIIYVQKDATGRIFMFDVAGNFITSYAYNYVPQGTAVVGDKMFTHKYTDTNTIRFLYSLANTRSELVRWVMI